MRLGSVSEQMTNRNMLQYYSYPKSFKTKLLPAYDGNASWDSEWVNFISGHVYQTISVIAGPS